MLTYNENGRQAKLGRGDWHLLAYFTQRYVCSKCVQAGRLGTLVIRPDQQGITRLACYANCTSPERLRIEHLKRGQLQRHAEMMARVEAGIELPPDLPNYFPPGKEEDYYL